MPLVNAKCTNCGANLEVDNAKDAAICPYCQTAYIVEKAINNYSITNNINAEQVNIFYSDSEENKIQREFEKIDGFIKIDDLESANSSLETLSNTYPGYFEVWKKYLDFLYLCVDNGYSVGKPLVRTINCINKLCPENQKDEIQNLIDNKSEDICKKVENGELSIISLCSAVDFKKGDGLLNEKNGADSRVRLRWNELLNEIKNEGKSFISLLDYCEQILDMLGTLNAGYDFKSKLFCTKEFATDEILFVIGRDLITLHKDTGGEAYLNRYRINVTASTGSCFCDYVKNSKRLFKARYDLKILENKIEKVQESINHYSDSANNMSVIDAMINSKEKNKCKKELKELMEEKNALINSINNLQTFLK